MMTHEATNGHVSSEVIDVELSESQDSIEREVPGNSVVESDETPEAIQWDLEDIKATFEALLFVSPEPIIFP